MRNTRRIRRMSRNRVKIGKMNLTSLMDVFTILVFFLLVNSGSVEVMEAPKTVVLPELRVETKPRETVVIFISPDEVLVQGKSVIPVQDILDSESLTIDPVTERLQEIGQRVLGPNTALVAESQLRQAIESEMLSTGLFIGLHIGVYIGVCIVMHRSTGPRCSS